METEVEILREHYGNHSNVAEVLGITPRQYRRIRNNGKASKTVAKLMAHLAKELCSSESKN